MQVEQASQGELDVNGSKTEVPGAGDVTREAT